MESKFSARLQHGRIFGEDISIDAPQALDALHQHPAEPVILEPRAPNSAVFSLNS
jgi:hypothetical protein